VTVKAHQRYLARLEDLKRRWGPLAYGGSQVVGGPCPDRSEAVVSELRTLLENGDLAEPFSLLQIAPSASSVAATIAEEFQASCYALASAGAVAEDERVRVYDVDMR